MNKLHPLDGSAVLIRYLWSVMLSPSATHVHSLPGEYISDVAAELTPLLEGPYILVLEASPPVCQRDGSRVSKEYSRSSSSSTRCSVHGQ